MLGLTFYVLSAILDVLAITGILDHQLEMAQPLRGLIDVYRAAVHGPLVWLNHFFIPNLPMPSATCDVAAAWVAFWIAANASLLRLEGQSLFGKVNAMATEYGVSRAKRYLMLAVGPLAILFFGPPFFVYFAIRRGFPIDPDSKGLLIFLTAVISSVLIIIVFDRLLKIFA